MEEEWAWPELKRISDIWREGVRARDWPVGDLPKLIERSVGHWQAFYVRQIAYYYALDTRQYSVAQEQILEAILECGRWAWGDEEFLAHLLFEQLFLQAYLRQNFKDYVHCLDDYGYYAEYAWYSRGRAEAAVYAARQDMKSANRIVADTKERIAKENPEIKPNIQAELDWLDAILVGPAPWH